MEQPAGKTLLTLPAPLSEESFRRALVELPTSDRLAAESCYQCYQGDTFSAEEFLSHIRSLAPQSPTLFALLYPTQGPTHLHIPAHAPAQPLPEGPAAPSPDTHVAHVERAMAAVVVKTEASRAYAGSQDQSFEAGTGSKVEHAVDMSSSLIRRLRNVARRRKLEGHQGTEQMRSRSYLVAVIGEMARQLPMGPGSPAKSRM
ncbi:hypothetical protein T484DRAFT_1853670 [Baffinella frigidus]|nr:hypothetical protein T484DRAFT_1853670 [Cryptophyta sp. CCMP2293]